MYKTLLIKGMHCGHCAGMVQVELFKIPEVVDVSISVTKKNAIVRLSSPVSFETFACLTFQRSSFVSYLQIPAHASHTCGCSWPMPIRSSFYLLVAYTLTRTYEDLMMKKKIDLKLQSY